MKRKRSSGVAPALPARSACAALFVRLRSGASCFVFFFFGLLGRRLAFCFFLIFYKSSMLPFAPLAPPLRLICVYQIPRMFTVLGWLPLIILIRPALPFYHEMLLAPYGP